MRALAALAAALITCSAAAQTIGPVTIGAARSTLPKQPNQSCAARACTYPVLPLGSATVEMFVGFDETDHVDGVIVSAAVSDGPEIAAAAIAKLGKPTSDRRSVVQNGFGAVFDQRVIHWRSARFVLRHPNDLERSELQVLSAKRAAQNRAEEAGRVRM